MFHVCALRLSGHVDCWGGDSFSQNSQNETSPPSNAVFASLSVGSFQHSCGLTAGGVVECWGNPALIGAVPSTLLSSISAGGYFNCGIALSDNSLVCWHDVSATNLGPQPTGEFSMVTVDVNVACALRLSNGTAVCWGNSEDPEQITVPDPTESYSFIESGKSSGSPEYAYTCAVRQSNGTIALPRAECRRELSFEPRTEAHSRRRAHSRRQTRILSPVVACLSARVPCYAASMLLGCLDSCQARYSTHT